MQVNRTVFTMLMVSTSIVFSNIVLYLVGNVSLHEMVDRTTFMVLAVLVYAILDSYLDSMFQEFNKERSFK